MRKILLLCLLVVACSSPSDLAQVNTSNDSAGLNVTPQRNASFNASVNQSVDRSGPVDVSTLDGLKKRLNQVYHDRAAAVKQRRTVLNKLRDAAFEDRSFYENALGILDERISDYKREIDVLEAQVDAVEAAREREERLARLRETVEDLSEEREALLDQFDSLDEGTDVDVRNGSVSALREALERQAAVLEDIEEKERALDQRREEIASLENASASYDEDLLVEREEIRYELEQVRADIIDAYLSGNASVDELRREEKRLEASLENVTDELTR